MWLPQDLFEVEKSRLLLYFLPSQIKLSSAACNCVFGFPDTILWLIEKKSLLVRVPVAANYTLNDLRWHEQAWQNM